MCVSIKDKRCFIYVRTCECACACVCVHIYTLNCKHIEHIDRGQTLEPPGRRVRWLARHAQSTELGTGLIEGAPRISQTRAQMLLASILWMEKNRSRCFEDVGKHVLIQGESNHSMISYVVRIAFHPSTVGSCLRRGGGRCLRLGDESGSLPRSSSREVRIRVPTVYVVYFSRRTLPKKRAKGHYWGT